MNAKEQSQLIGHEAIELDVLNSWKNGRLPHSILLTGPKGVGRSTLAFRLAKFLLSNPDIQSESLYVDPTLPVCRRILSGGHGDLLVIEPDPEKATKEIAVDQVRQVKQFLSQTSMEGGWRIVIVDGEMNGSAANAILKVLEEPPKKSLLIIMAESTGRVLPTIRSRCHMIKLKPLTNLQVMELLQEQCPEISLDEAKVLSVLCDGRPGMALQYHEAQAVSMYRELLKILGRLSSFNFGEALSFSQRYSGKSKSEDLEVDPFIVIGDLIKRFIQKLTHYATAQETHSVLPEEIPIFQQALSLKNAMEWARIWETTNQNFRQANRFHLDKSLVIYCSLCEIAGVKA